MTVLWLVKASVAVTGSHGTLSASHRGSTRERIARGRDRHHGFGSIRTAAFRVDLAEDVRIKPKITAVRVDGRARCPSTGMPAIRAISSALCRIDQGFKKALLWFAWGHEAWQARWQHA